MAPDSLITPVPSPGFVLMEQPSSNQKPIPSPGFVLMKQIDEEPFRDEVNRIVDDYVFIGDEKTEPNNWDKFLRVFEPDWEERRAKAALSLTKSKETEQRGEFGDVVVPGGRRAPHEFEPLVSELAVSGFESSISGLIYRGKAPDTLTPQQISELPTTQRILVKGAMLSGDLPFMIAGMVAGSPGGPPTALGGAFALPMGMRKVLMDKYEKREVDSFGEFWRRLLGATNEALKGMATGLATYSAGLVGGLPAEIAAMVSVGSALEGRVPEPQDFTDAAILIGGLKYSNYVVGKLRLIYRNTGKTPWQVMQDINEDPYIRKDLLSDAKEVPGAYRGPIVEDVPKPEFIDLGDISAPKAMISKKIGIIGRIKKAVKKKPSESKLTTTEIEKDINAITEAVSQRGAISLRQQAPKAKPFEFENPDIEKRIQTARGVKSEEFWNKLNKAFVSIKNKITRQYENLPRTEEFSQLGFDLRALAKQKGVAGYKTLMDIKGITLSLDKNEYNLFWRKILLEDLAETTNEGKLIPFGLDKDIVNHELIRLNNAIKNSPDVNAALETRTKVWAVLKTAYIKAMKEIGVDVSSRFTRKNYLRHQVLDYAQLKGIIGTGKKLKAPTGRSFLKKRMGGENDINTDYIQAEHEVMAQMLYDIEVAKTIKAVDNNYNIAAEVRKYAKNNGIENWKDAIPDGHRTWQPKEGNVFYLTDTIPAKLAEKLASGALEEIGLTADQVSKVLAVGGKRKQFVLRNEVADTLDSLVNEKSNNAIAQAHKKVLRWWKMWQLLSPRRFSKYNSRNLTGDADAVFCGRPSVFLEVPEAVKELWGIYGQGKTMKGDLLEWFERGGMESNLQAQEMGELNQLKMFMHLHEQRTGLKKIPLQIWQTYWKTARLSTDIREAILRFSAYKRFKKEMLASPDGMPKDFGASLPEEVRGLNSIEDKSYMMANDLLGAYDRVGIMGQNLRDHLYPFWSFKEANFRRYTQMFKNAANSDQLAEAVGRKALGALAKTPYQAIRVGKFLLKATAFWSALQVWNNLMYNEEEKMLPPEVRNRPHVILPPGRTEDGEIIAFTRIGALGDLLDVFGLDAAPQYVDGLLQGKMTLKEIAVDMAKQPLNIVVQGGEPFVKMGAELLSRRALFPDIYRPRTIRDRTMHVMRGFGLENEFKALTDKPSKGYAESLKDFFVYTYDPLQSAYGEFMEIKTKFLRSKGKSGEGFWLTPRGNAMYDARLAIRYKDNDAAMNAMSRYLRISGIEEEMKIQEISSDLRESFIQNKIKKSLESMNPLSGIAKYELKEFSESLSAEDKKIFMKAQLFYLEILTGENYSKKLFTGGQP